MTEQTEPRRGPGRPPNQPATRAQEVQLKRRRREGMGAERNMKLHIPEDAKDPNFTYRWVNDRPGRVRNLTIQDDYDVVSANELNGAGLDLENGPAAEGSVMKRTGDKFTGESMVLLKKPKEFYLKDKAEEQKLIDARDALLRKAPPTDSGDGLTAKDNAYIPGGRNIIAGK